MSIYLTSDTHFCHDKPFLYEPRGFNSIDDMNKTIINNWNGIVTDQDDIYVLGDFFLGTDTDYIRDTIGNLRGKIHLIIGNHDTPAKIELYKELRICEVLYATQIKFKKRLFYLSHYPTLTATLQSNPEKAIFNLFGHTHSKDKFYEDSPYMYNVAVDANDNTPVSIDFIYDSIMKKISETVV